MRADDAALAGDVLWFGVRRTAIDGRRCREYRITDASGAGLLSAVAFYRGRDIVVMTAAAAPFLVIRRARLFPLTGKAAVLDQPTGRRIGFVGRNGRYRDDGRTPLGRYRDARTLRDRAAESVVQAAFEAVLGGVDSGSASGPTAFILELGGRSAGTLVHGRFPFAGSEEPDRPAPSRLGRVARALVPTRAMQVAEALTAPRGWRLERTRPLPGDPRVHLAAALFAIELSYW